MGIPGIQDFYDGMHEHMAHQIEHAIDHTHQPIDSHQDQHVSDHHDHGAHTLADLQHDSHDHHDEHFIDKLIPAAVQGIVSGAVKFAAEMATDAILSGDLMSSNPANDHSHHNLYVGTTDGDGFVHQTTGFTCAVASQQMILHQFHLVDPHTGEPISEAKLVYDATSNGWLSDHGTSVENLGKLLDHYGIANHQGSDWSHLLHDLAAGHQVVMAVNADHLWNAHSPLSDIMNLFGNHPNHAIVVKGLRVDDHGKVMVVVNDPGHIDGAGAEYPLEHFQSAVESAHMHYVATDHAPHDWCSVPALRALAHDYEAMANSRPCTSIVDFDSKFTDPNSQMTEVERLQFLRSV